MEGKTVRLERPAAARDAALLFEATHGEHADPAQWTYMAYGPFESADAMRAVLARLVDGSQDPQWWLVRALASDAPVGMAAFHEHGPRPSPVGAGPHLVRSRRPARASTGWATGASSGNATR